jgi:hypothetical protein
MTYSWGQIRLLLQQFAGPGVSLDTIDEKINSRYALILSLMDWHGLEVNGMLQTLAAYNTGTISVTQGSTAVTGTGTNWVSAMNGLQLLTCFGLPYNVTILSNTALTLDRPFEGATNATLGYWLGQVVYQLPDNCRHLSTITSPELLREIPPMDEIEFAQLEGAPITWGGPSTRYVPQPDGVNAQTGAIVKQIMLWPLPWRAQGYPLVYEQVAEGFDGVSTTDGPLPFVSPHILIAGCKADLAADAGKLDQAISFNGTFDKHFAGMVHVESSSKPYPAPRMAGRYTRHRVLRVLRQLGGCFRDC